MQKGRSASGPSVVSWSVSDTSAATSHRKLPSRRTWRASVLPLGPDEQAQKVRPVRVMSWNAGHLGHQQWVEIKTWLQLEADKVCDVLILQETHWQESAEFTVSGWYCISSASKHTASQRKASQRAEAVEGSPVRQLGSVNYACRWPDGAPVSQVSLETDQMERVDNGSRLGGPSLSCGLSHYLSCGVSACLVLQQDTAGQ